MISWKTLGVLQLLLGCLVLGGCGGCSGPPVDPEPSPGQNVGGPCQVSEDCQDGLECAQQECVHRRCTQSADPGATCAFKLQLPRERVECKSDGVCAIKQSQIGDACVGDDGCVFGSVCFEDVCVEQCRSDLSCTQTSYRCLPRTTESEVRVCQMPTCRDDRSPMIFCEEELSTRRGGARCLEDGSCELVELPRGEACILWDASCTGSDVCEQGICRQSCLNQDECDDASQQCSPRASDASTGFCEEDPRCDTKLQPDTYCRMSLNDPSAFCSRTLGECSRGYGVDSKVMVLISDRSNQCDALVHNQAAPGSDLTFVRLYDDQMNLKARGELAEHMSNDILNDYDTLPRELQAQGAANIDENLCPRPDLQNRYFTDDSVWSMGCRGRAWFRFRDLSFGLVTMEPGDSLIVGEFNNECSNEEMQSEADRYEVSLCTCTCPQGCGAVDGCITCVPTGEMNTYTGLQVFEITP